MGPHSKGPITPIPQDILVQPASGAVRRYTYGVLRLLVQSFHAAEVGDADPKAAAGAGTARASSQRWHHSLVSVLVAVSEDLS